ncbi:hypothetical protein [Sphingopyxis granuli]|uniref:hypothetical protein n=1 Tax=Sphingopyxis granuli TaxID=267128 RepID=UPI001BB0D56C|nr:hypothetical protein [Sphingopyxis granuli]QUM74628.1 hypothetical protein ICN83_20910 [Sphingopyxis granuli]
MVSVTTPREQAETSEAARKVGGYGELIRLQDERTAIRRRGLIAKLIKNPQTGRFKYIAAS